MVLGLISSIQQDFIYSFWGENCLERVIDFNFQGNGSHLSQDSLLNNIVIDDLEEDMKS